MMLVYIVRVHETKKIVGIFWAPSKLEMWHAIDELADPDDCEYVPVKFGGGIEFTIEEKDDQVDFAMVDLSGNLLDDLLQSERKWKRVNTDAEYPFNVM